MSRMPSSVARGERLGTLVVEVDDADQLDAAGCRVGSRAWERAIVPATDDADHGALCVECAAAVHLA